jgi:CheY-like chemotaxis protein
LLLDLMVPKLTGIELLKRLRGSQTLSSLPIIAFSGSEELLAEAKRLGATRTLSKDEYVPNQIVARITEVIATLRKVGDSDELFTSTRAWVPPSGRILIVEDDPVIMQLVKDVVVEEGYCAVCAPNGGEAFRILAKDSVFAAGIFDVRMPAIQGTDLLRHMQTEKRLSKIPVLIMTSEQSTAIQAESFSAGAAIFLPKPFTRVALKGMFRTLVSKNPNNSGLKPSLN